MPSAQVGSLLDGRVVETTRRRWTPMPNTHVVTADHTPTPSPLADAPPASAESSAFGPVRPDRMTVWPTEDGRFGIDVRWAGRECILRSVVVRRLLTDAGYATATGN